MSRKNKVTLVLYPNTHGLAYLICENAQEVLDYGIKKLKPFSKYKFIKKVEWVFDFTEADVVIVLNYKESTVSKRIQKAIQEIEKLSEERNLNIKKYSRDQIKQTFLAFEANTKYEIAIQITKWYSELDILKPYKRKPWLPEHYQMGVFDAFALMLTHYYLEN